jgi:fumarate reductase subunit C
MPATKASHPNAMAPRTPGKTRTAPPMQPASWKTSPRMKQYSRFGMTGWIYLVASFTAIEIVWALGSGPEAYEAMQQRFANPIVILIHLVALVSVGYVLVRFFGLFPKAQPARIGPAKPPPQSVLTAMLYGAWIGITVVLSVILAGGIF